MPSCPAPIQGITCPTDSQSLRGIFAQHVHASSGLLALVHSHLQQGHSCPPIQGRLCPFRAFWPQSPHSQEHFARRGTQCANSIHSSGRAFWPPRASAFSAGPRRAFLPTRRGILAHRPRAVFAKQFSKGHPLPRSRSKGHVLPNSFIQLQGQPFAQHFSSPKGNLAHHLPQ